MSSTNQPEVRRRRRARRAAVAVTAVTLVLAVGPTATPGADPAGAAPAGAAGVVGAIEDRTPSVIDAPSEPTRPLSVAREVDLEPFTLVGLTLPAAVGPVLVRVRRDGTWTDWQELHFGADHAAEGEGDAATVRPGAHSEPIWVGVADGYELLLPRDAGAPIVHLGRDEPGVTTAAIPPADVRAFAASPGVRSRGEWGARPAARAAVEASDLRVAFVHHSVSTNTYGPGEVPGILRGIQSYHMDVNGWSDIGYNFAVDRFGGIWEAHGGGIIRAIVGGHAAGFNTTSVGVVMLGDFSATSPPAAMISSVAEIIAWRMAVAGTDPNGAVDFTTSTGSTKYEPGTTVRLDRISGHRDVGLTACPGELGYAQLATIRALARTRYRAYAGTVVTRWLTSPTHRFTDLAGESPDESEIVATAPDRLEVAVRGLDDALYTSRWDGTGWVPWERVGGILLHGPALLHHDDVLEAFVVGAGGGLYTTRRTGTAAWGPWTALGGVLTSRPDVVRLADGTVAVVGRGLDQAVWLRIRAADGTWGPWSSLAGGTPAGSAPAIATPGANRIDVVLHGLDNRLWVRSNDGPSGSFTAWRAIGGVVTDSPAAVGGAVADGIDVVVRGSDGRLYATRRTPAGWSPFVLVSRERTGGGPALTSWGPGRLDLTAATPDGRLFQTWWSPSSGW